VRECDMTCAEMSEEAFWGSWQSNCQEKGKKRGPCGLRFFISGVLRVAGEPGLLLDPLSGFSANAPFGVFDPVCEIYGGMPFQDIAACIAKFGHRIILQRSNKY
jgi:hypothetical protein